MKDIKREKKDKRTNLEKEIDSILLKMSALDPASTEYSAMTANLERLLNAKSKEKDKCVSPDTLAIVAANLLGIGLILYKENIGPITTKALNFVIRGRV